MLFKLSIVPILIDLLVTDSSSEGVLGTRLSSVEPVLHSTMPTLSRAPNTLELAPLSIRGFSDQVIPTALQPARLCVWTQ